MLDGAMVCNRARCAENPIIIYIIPPCVTLMLHVCQGSPLPPTLDAVRHDY